MNEVTLGDKIYISSKRAAEITGYAKDYVGQLCREGHVDAKMIGRSWYVYEPSIRAHRFGPESVVEEPPAATSESLVETVEAVEVIEEGLEDGVSDAHEWKKPVYTAESHQMLPEMPEASPVMYEAVSPVEEETLTDMQSAWKEWFDRKQQVLSTPEIESPEVVDARDEEYEAEDDELSDEDPEEDTDDADGAVEIPLHHLEDEEMRRSEPETNAESIQIHPIEAHVRAPVPFYPSYYAAPETKYTAEVQPSVRVGTQQAAYAQQEQPEAMIINERVIPKGSSKARTGKRDRRTNHSAGIASNAPMIALLVGISIVTIAITVIGSGVADHYVQTFSSNNPVVNFLTGTREINK